MKSLLSHFALAAASLALASSASATVLNFDDLATDGFVPASYGGLDWSAGDWFAFGEVQDPYNAHSGDVRITSGFGDPDAATAIGLGQDETFQGAWFAGLDGATINFQLYENGALVATSATLDPSSAPTWLSSGYAGLVDKVVISSPFQGSWVMDDFTFAAAVPEPASTTLMLAGLVAFGIVARRRANTRG
jgi:opacity protein-like surface antigen